MLYGLKSLFAACKTKSVIYTRTTKKTVFDKKTVFFITF